MNLYDSFVMTRSIFKTIKPIENLFNNTLQKWILHELIVVFASVAKTLQKIPAHSYFFNLL